MDIMLKGKSIGIDLGHCETTISYPYINGERPEIMPMQVLGSRESVVLTQVHLTCAQMQKLKGHRLPSCEVLESLGEIRIGGLPASAEDGEVFRYFKVCPEAFDNLCAMSDAGISAGITHGQVTACFLYAALTSALRNSTYMTEDDLEQLTLYVGCPATGRWTQEEPRRRYAELLKTATGVKAVEIVPESRAALFSSLENREYRALSAANGVVVFDFGSSTADCTFMRLGKGSLEFSWTLGAHAIERNMVRLVLEQLCESKGCFIPDDVSVQSAVDVCRRIKESYYRGEFDPDGYAAGFAFRDQAGIKHKDMILIDDAFMTRAAEAVPISVSTDDGSLLSGSFSELCRAFMEFARGEMKRSGFDASTAVLAGGASRMPFIERLCREVFGPEMTIYREVNPSFTVSNGLGWIAVVESNFDDCVKAAHDAVAADGRCGIDALKNALRPKLQEILRKEIVTAASAWSNAASDKSIRDLNEEITCRLESLPVQAEVLKCLGTQIQAWKGAFREGVLNAVNEQSKKLFSSQAARNLMLRADVWEAMQAKNIKVKIDESKLINALDLNSLWIRLAKLISTVGWLAALGWLGPLGIGAALLLSWLTRDMLSDKNTVKPRDRKKRRALFKQIKKELEKDACMQQMTRSIDESLEGLRAGYDEMLYSAVEHALSIAVLRSFD